MAIGITASNSSASTATLATPSRTTTTGSALYAFCWWGSAAFNGITDSNSNAWTQIGAEINTSSHKSRLYYAKNITGGAGHTVQMALGSADACSIILIEVLSANTSTPNDQTDQRDDTSSPFTLAAGLTTTQADEELLVFLAGTSGSNPATHAESGIGSMTLREEVTNGTSLWTGAAWTKTVAATGTYNPSATESGAGTGHIYLVTVKIASSVPTAPVIKRQARKALRGSVRRNFDVGGWFNTRGHDKGWFWREWAPAGSSNVTVALSGVSSTASVGTATPANSLALTGNAATSATGNVTASQPITGVAATGAVGTVGITHDQELTGNSSTGALGTVAPANSVALSGNASTGAVNAPGVTHDQALTGNVATSATGTVVPGITIALTGVAATGSVGSVSVATTDVTVALTGVSASGAAGTVAPASSIALTGTSSTPAVGTLTPGTAKALTGSASSTAVGSAASTTAPALTGTSITGGAGTVAPASSIPLTGSIGSGQVGNVTYTAGVVIALTGVSASGEVGSVVVPVFADTSPYRTTARPAAGRLGSNPDAVQAGRLGQETDTAAEARLGSTPDAVAAGRLGTETATPTAARLGARTT